MKTVFKDGAGYERVSDELGEKMVDRQGYRFVPKSEWKLKVRGPLQAEQSIKKVEEEAKKEETLSKKAASRSAIKAKQRPPAAADRLLK